MDILVLQNPRSIAVAALVYKEGQKNLPVTTYIGFCTDRFIIGYGMDYGGRYRQLPFITAPEDETDLDR